jgi:hypothetical protein
MCWSIECTHGKGCYLNVSPPPQNSKATETTLSLVTMCRPTIPYCDSSGLLSQHGQIVCELWPPVRHMQLHPYLILMSFLFCRVVVAVLSLPSSPTIWALPLQPTWDLFLTISLVSLLLRFVPRFTPCPINTGPMAPWAWNSWRRGTRPPCTNREPTPRTHSPSQVVASPPLSQGSPRPYRTTTQAFPSTRFLIITYLMSSQSMTAHPASCILTTKTITPPRRRNHISRNLSMLSCCT